MKRVALPLTLALAATSLAACGDDSTSGSTASGGKATVVTAFYPLEYLVDRIGGDHVEVQSLTAPGAEPHELELTPKQIAEASKADLGVYEKDFQPAVDEAFANAAPKKLLDVATAADLTLSYDHDAEVGEAEHEHTEGDGHDHGGSGNDPHFWLDPVRYAKVADAVATSLSEASPANKATFETNLAALKKDLTALDGELEAGLASCTSKNVVTSHAAFGYLTNRYGLKQVAISGISPEQEPEPAQLAKIAAYAKANKVTTIYTETLASPAIAKTVAAETGATTAVLDPIEGITKASAAQDYLGVMRANLAALKKGQSCS